MSNANDAARALWAHWISETYLSDATIADLKNWFTSRPRSPRRLDTFLNPARVTKLSDSLRSVETWERMCCVLDDTMVLPEEVTPSRWSGSHQNHRFSSQWIARPFVPLLEAASPLAPEHRAILIHFLTFMLFTPAFRSWLARIVGSPISPNVPYEVVKYHKGDFISEHSDIRDNRVVGACFYLGGAWQPADGGVLCYRNECGQEFRIDPLFNSISLIPIAHGCVHWVTPWNSPTSGRETFAAGFSLEDDAYHNPSP